jgi:mRNA interferase RelE/StbE
MIRGDPQSSPPGKGPFQLKLTEQMAARLRRMHPLIKRKIKAALRIILQNPGAGKALKDELDGLRSFRVGRIRIIYRIKPRVVEIVTVGPRERIYEETYRMIKKDRLK